MAPVPWSGLVDYSGNPAWRFALVISCLRSEVGKPWSGPTLTDGVRCLQSHSHQLGQLGHRHPWLVCVHPAPPTGLHLVHFMVTLLSSVQSFHL